MGPLDHPLPWALWTTRLPTKNAAEVTDVEVFAVPGEARVSVMPSPGPRHRHRVAGLWPVRPALERLPCRIGGWEAAWPAGREDTRKEGGQGVLIF